MNHRSAYLPRFRLSTLLGVTLIVALTVGWWTTSRRLRNATTELAELRDEVGYLPPTTSDLVAAVRLNSDEPLTYRIRIRIPEDASYRVVYSSIWPKSAAKPDWFAGLPVPSGESIVLVRIASDPRDDRWKITTLVQSPKGTKRIATVLPKEHEQIFRGSYDALSTGVGRQSVTKTVGNLLRILDERWLVGEGGLLLYGDRAPERDQVGVYAELQPADRPL